MSPPNTKRSKPLDGIQKIHIQPEHWDAMQTHMLSCMPNEACGILGGRGERVHVVIPVTNILHSPYRFRMDPSEQLSAFLKIENMGHEIIGIFHSHVYGPGDPSVTDLEESYYPNVAYLIWFPAENRWKCRSFRLIDGSVIEIPLLVDSK